MVIPSFYSTDEPEILADSTAIACDCFFPNGIYISLQIPKDATISELKEVSLNL